MRKLKRLLAFMLAAGLFFTEIEVENGNEEFVPSEFDKEVIKN